jgi:hypothetical protein
MHRQPKGCLLFDWGDTLMRDFKDYPGPMKDWPRLEAIPGAAEALAALQPVWILALATNANDSDEADIRAALQRVNLDQFLDRVYCSKNVGHKKPSVAFYQYILVDLGLTNRSPAWLAIISKLMYWVQMPAACVPSGSTSIPLNRGKMFCFGRSII